MTYPAAPVRLRSRDRDCHSCHCQL